MTHRLFVACEFSDQVRETLIAAIERLRGKLGGREADNIRWVDIDHLHVTIRFIGHVEDEIATRLTELFRPSIPLAPFRCQFGPLQAFPSPRRPRVVSVGIDEGRVSFEALHLEVSTRLAIVGVPPEERRYHPHVTVGRVREQALRMSTLRNVLEGEEPIAGESLIDHVTLFESRLSRLGSSYTPLVRAFLQGAIENA